MRSKILGAAATALSFVARTGSNLSERLSDAADSSARSGRGRGSRSGRLRRFDASLSGAAEAPTEEAVAEPEAIEHRDGFDVVRGADATLRIVCHDSTIEGVVCRLLRMRRSGCEDDALEVQVDRLLPSAKAIGRMADQSGDDQLLALALFLKERRMDGDEALAERIASGELLSDEIPLRFKTGTEVVAKTPEGVEFAGRVQAIRRQRMPSGAMVWQFGLEVISVDANGPIDAVAYAQLATYAGMRSASSLSIAPLTDEIRTRLAARGEIFRAHAQGVSFRFHPEFGRVVLDAKGAESYGRVSMPTRRDGDDDEDGTGGEGDAESTRRSAIDDDELHLCWPFLPGFVLRAKEWRTVPVAGLTSIAFRSDAFERLVLDPVRKRTFKALVQHHDVGFKDVVDGKSGGVIVLLHGPAGVGKTLSAEATAEILERPLYVVSVGELGTDPERLERGLMRALHMTQPWGAVVLLDEADVFLEKRDTHDVFRNAMVAVFLRVLEYHNGVLFLTTNRVEEFDPAFHSRISLALRYGAMDTATRAAVWNNLLESAGLSGFDIAALAESALNGRQIKNCIRLAQTMAASEGRPVVQGDLEDVVATVARFAVDTQS